MALLPGVPSAQDTLVSRRAERRMQKPNMNMGGGGTKGAWAINPRTGLKSMLLCDFGEVLYPLWALFLLTVKQRWRCGVGVGRGGLVKFMSFQWETLSLTEL